MDVRKWPRKNDAESIRTRQEALGLDGSVTAIELEPFSRAQEMLTGAAVIPVSVVGPLELELGEYELREPDGEVEETGRARRRRVGWVPHLRARRPDHPRLLLRLRLGGRGDRACPLDRGRARVDAR